MNALITNIELALPEMILLGSTIVVLFVHLYVNVGRTWITYFFTQLGLLTTIIITYLQFSTCLTGVTCQSYAFSQQFVLDNLSVLLKLSVYVLTFIAMWYSRNYI